MRGYIVERLYKFFCCLHILNISLCGAKIRKVLESWEVLERNFWKLLLPCAHGREQGDMSFTWDVLITLSILFVGAFEIVDGEGELEAADVVEDDGGAFLAIDHLYGALQAFQGLGL